MAHLEASIITISMPLYIKKKYILFSNKMVLKLCGQDGWVLARFFLYVFNKCFLATELVKEQWGSHV